MTRFLRLFTLLFLMLGAFSSNAQLDVENQANAFILAEKILGPGVTIMNAQFKGAAISAGTFSSQPGSFPLSSGIVLTSGRAKTTGTGPGERGVDGPANYNGSDVSQASLAHFPTQPGDADLSIYSGKQTFDACVLEFDFIPQGDSINVRYIFGSEEYPVYTCSDFNDAFAFLITGPGFSTPTNIALVPNTNIPVAINSINDGIPGPDLGSLPKCTTMGAGSPFIQYYVSNQGGMVYTYNGRTVVLTAKAKVQPCQVYHIKLVIADADDRSWDSGVFIEAGSFSSKPEFKTSVSGPLVTGNEAVMIEACKPAEIKVTRSPGTVGPFTVNISYGGSASPGTDFTSLPAQLNFSATENEKVFPITAVADALNEGTEKAVFYFTKNLACTQELADSIVVFIKDSLVITSRLDTFMCSSSPAIIKSKDPVANTTNTYLWNNGSTTQSILVSQAATYWVAHTYSQRCVNIDSFVVLNRDPSFALSNVNPVVCDGSPTDVTLTTNADSIKWNTGATTPTITISSPGEYWVIAKNTWGCSKADTFAVTQRPSPVLDLGNDTALCPGETISLNAFYPGASYQWSNGRTSSVITTSDPGTYTVTSTLNGCSSKDTITIAAKKVPVVNAGKDLVVEQFKSIQLNAEQHADNASYLWSPAFTLSNATIANPLATPTATTEYTLRVTSVDGCVGQDKLWVTVQYPLLIPNAFSPNGDNINDRWRIGNINYYPEATIQVFNRYGQPMFSSRGNRDPWDGTFKGRLLEPATYYYVIEPGDGRRFGGWVVLLR